jgi:hypothetical protein
MNRHMYAGRRISPILLSLLIALPSIVCAQSVQPTAQSAPTAAAESTSDATAASTTDTAKAKQGKTGSAKRTVSGDTSVEQAPPPSPTSKGRWVSRIDYKHCPNGTTSFVAEDGGVKCWAGPVN